MMVQQPRADVAKLFFATVAFFAFFAFFVFFAACFFAFFTAGFFAAFAFLAFFAIAAPITLYGSRRSLECSLAEVAIGMYVQIIKKSLLLFFGNLFQ